MKAMYQNDVTKPLGSVDWKKGAQKETYVMAPPWTACHETDCETATRYVFRFRFYPMVQRKPPPFLHFVLLCSKNSLGENWIIEHIDESGKSFVPLAQYLPCRLQEENHKAFCNGAKRADEQCSGERKVEVKTCCGRKRTHSEAFESGTNI